jgi:ABC-type hemin transport system substrate-binding protein
VYGPTKELRKKSLNLEEIIPQRLKPDLFLIKYEWAEARTLQQLAAECVPFVLD